MDFIFIIFPVSFYYWWDEQRRLTKSTVRRKNLAFRSFISFGFSRWNANNQRALLQPPQCSQPSTQTESFWRLAVARFSSPWLGTKLSQSYMITQRRSRRHRNDRMTHRLSHVIVEDGPGRGGHGLDHCHGSKWGGGNALASLGPLFFFSLFFFFSSLIDPPHSPFLFPKQTWRVYPGESLIVLRMSAEEIHSCAFWLF